MSALVRAAHIALWLATTACTTPQTRTDYEELLQLTLLSELRQQSLVLKYLADGNSRTAAELLSIRVFGGLVYFDHIKNSSELVIEKAKLCGEVRNAEAAVAPHVHAEPTKNAELAKVLRSLQDYCRE